MLSQFNCHIMLFHYKFSCARPATGPATLGLSGQCLTGELSWQVGKYLACCGDGDLPFLLPAFHSLLYPEGPTANDAMLHSMMSMHSLLSTVGMSTLLSVVGIHALLSIVVVLTLLSIADMRTLLSTGDIRWQRLLHTCAC